MLLEAQPIDHQEQERLSSNTAIDSQVRAVFKSFHERVLGGNTGESTENDRRAERALETTIDFIHRNNALSEITHSRQFGLEVKKPDGEMAGETPQGEIFCPDGRIVRRQFSYVVNTWEELSGRTATRRRESDNLLIVKSSALGEAFRHPNALRFGLINFAWGHYDSLDKNGGCADNTQTLNELRNNVKAQIDYFSEREVEALLRLNPEDANLEILERTTATAGDNFHNSARLAAGRRPLPRVTITGLYDTAYMGKEFRNGNDILSSTDLTERYRHRIEDANVAAFGQFKDTFSNDQYFLDYQKAKVALVCAMVYDVGHGFSGLKNEIGAYTSRNYPNLLAGQMRRFRHTTKHQIAHQYLMGLDTNHPYRHHSERILVASVNGLIPGKNLPDQVFATSASDPKEGARQINVELGVLDKHDLVADTPRSLLVCSSANPQDLANYGRSFRNAKHELADFLIALVANPDLRRRMNDGNLIPVPVIQDERTRKVLAVPDFSPYL